MWIALQQSCKAEFLSNWDAAKVGLDVQEVPVAEPGMEAGQGNKVFLQGVLKYNLVWVWRVTEFGGKNSE